MSNTLQYEQSFIHVGSNDDARRIVYTRCLPPSRLKPKGTVILLHDLFRTSYQFRHVVDLFAMGGYNTICPDLPGSHVWPRRRIDSRISRKTLASSLAEFLDVLHIHSVVHLVGCGLGAEIASSFGGSHPSRTASITCSHALHSSMVTNRYQMLLSLSPASSNQACVAAFMHDLDDTSSLSTISFRADIQEYVNAYSDCQTILQMQLVCRTVCAKTTATTRADDRSHTSTLLLQTEHDETPSQLFETSSCTIRKLPGTSHSLPEEEPEHFALAILSFLNQVSAEDTGSQIQLNSRTIAPRL